MTGATASSDTAPEVERKPVYDVIVNRFSLRAAPLVLLGSFFMPPRGFSVSLCWFYNVTGLPCPGCGLTRSLACISHLQPGAALRYHPFGPALYALLVVLTVVSFAGEQRRAAFRAWLERSALASRSHAIYHGFVIVFVGFGLVRLGLAMAATEDWFHGI